MHRNDKPMAGGVKAIPYGAHKSIFNCLELTFQNKYQKKCLKVTCSGFHFGLI